MRLDALELDGVLRIVPERLADSRGYFARTYCAETFARAGLETRWVQHNLSFTARRGALRGLHFQCAPMSEVKIVTCTRGTVWDVIVDLRAGSPSFGRWIGVELDAETRHALYVPKGFAHGFQTLTDAVEMQYMHSEPYSREHDRGVRWSDPDLAIAWPLEPSEMSDKDKALPNFKDIEPVAP